MSAAKGVLTLIGLTFIFAQAGMFWIGAAAVRTNRQVNVPLWPLYVGCLFGIVAILL